MHGVVLWEGGVMRVSDAGSAEASTISRRGFLAGAVTLAAVAVVPLATAERASAAALARAPATLTRSSFTPLVQARFAMADASGRSVSVILSAIGDLDRASAGSETRFSLLFDGPTKSARLQGMYAFRNAQRETFSLFVVPVDRGVQAQHYQAIVYSK